MLVITAFWHFSIEKQWKYGGMDSADMRRNGVNKMLKPSFWKVSFLNKKRTGLVLALSMVIALAAAFDTGRVTMQTVSISETNLTEEKAAQVAKEENFTVKTAKQETETKETTNTIELAMVPEKAAAKLPKDEIRMMQAAEAQQDVAEEEQKYGELFGDCLSTESIAKAVCEDIEEETLELMSSAVGTTAYGYIKVYAGTTPLIITEDDKEVLLRIVEAEATAEDVKGRMLVANVIMNRVLSSKFPDNITDVVFQNNGKTYQFAPIKDGRYWSVTVSDETREAVERVLNGEDYSQGALYFAARKLANPNKMSWFDRDLKRLFQYGVHEFFTDK